ncbi:hypothetical protein M5792_004046 [Salmonella enterica]|nr:hypothetical protein [Salmonella enterica]
MSAPSGAAPYIPAALPPGCPERRECLPARQGPRIRSRMLHGPGVQPSGVAKARNRACGATRKEPRCCAAGAVFRRTLWRLMMSMAEHDNATPRHNINNIRPQAAAPPDSGGR